MKSILKGWLLRSGRSWKSIIRRSRTSRTSRWLLTLKRIEMLKLGVVRIFTARDQGRLDGYAIYFLRRNIHYQTSLQAVQDILFLSAGLRRGLAGYRFIKWCDEQLKKNVQVVYQHVKLAHNFGPVLERIGYEPVEVTYVRRLDPWDSQQL